MEFRVTIALKQITKTFTSFNFFNNCISIADKYKLISTVRQTEGDWHKENKAIYTANKSYTRREPEHLQ